MAETSIDALFDRIEAALTRIENVTARQRKREADLHARHEALKQAVSGSLEQIDALITAHRS